MRPIKLSFGKSVYSTRIPRRQISQIAEIGLFPIHPVVCPDDQERAQNIADLLNGTHEKDSLPRITGEIIQTLLPDGSDPPFHPEI